MQKTKFYSWKSTKGKLPKGCQLCVQGRKLVLFVTGICKQKCFFCPISEKKSGKDVVYANEWKVSSEKDVVEEAKLTGAKGAGITGGDPLARLTKTIKYIRLLKRKFGRKFHIHLYTPLVLVDSAKLAKLYRAGLDEIRFHPNLDDKKSWQKLLLARKFSWDIGVEIPVIPGREKQAKQLIDFIVKNNAVDFLNLNELERSDSLVSKLDVAGFKAKGKQSYGIKGSEQLAKKLLKYAEKKGIATHYCTAKLKDKVQLTERIKLRARGVAKEFDYVTEEGTLVRGAIYTSQTNKTLTKLRQTLHKKLGIPLKYLVPETKRKRIITSAAIVEEFKNELKQLNLKPAIVEEYPTWDAMLVDVQFV
jgi:hypothetical protein